MKYSTLVIIAASLSAISALPIIPGHSEGPNDPYVPRGILKREAEAEAATPEHHPSTANTPDIPRDILKREAEPEAYEGQHKGGKTDPHTIGKREAEPEAEAYWGQYKGGKTDPHTLEKRDARNDGKVPGRTVPIPKIN